MPDDIKLPNAYPGAAAGGRGNRLPSEWGYDATEPQMHSHRDGVAYDHRSDESIEYEWLRDTIIAAFNPPDEDSAEPDVVTRAVDRAWEFIVALPCECAAPHLVEEYGNEVTCGRCLALGRANDRRKEW